MRRACSGDAPRFLVSPRRLVIFSHSWGHFDRPPARSHQGGITRMKRTIALVLTMAIIVGAAVLSGQKASSSGDSRSAVPSALKIDQNDRNPWTHLRLNGGGDEFTFAIVSDRTGGHRAKIFSQAVERLNLMQPEFVVSVGDLIEGYSEKEDKVEEEWKEFQKYVTQLQMPFFYVPGNHDITNRVQERIWKDKFGRSYYHFVYK